MFFTYGPVTLDLCHLDRWDRVAEMDGPQYLWTKHTIRVTGVYNPQATSYGIPADVAGALPAFGPGRLAPTTDAAVRHELQQARQTLIISVGGQLMMLQPLIGALTDCNNGPYCESHSVVEAVGSKTFLVSGTFIVYTNEVRGNAPPVVVSHRWTMQDSIPSPHYLTARTIQGWATFRSDLMLFNGFVPDDFRRALTHPVLPDFQREHVDVAVSEDGNEIEYTVLDVEKDKNITANVALFGVTDIECYHSAEVNKPSHEEAITAIGGSLVRSGTAITTGGGLTSVGAGVILGALDVTLTVAQLLPRQYHTIVAKVFGRNGAKRKDLEKVGMSVCFGRMTEAAVDLTSGAVSLAVVYSFTRRGPVVEVTLRAKSGFERLTGAIELTAGDFASIDAVGAIPNRIFQQVRDRLSNVNQNIMPPNDEFPGVTTDSVVPNPTLPNIERGTSIGKLVAQILHNAIQVQTDPPGFTAARIADMQ